MDPSSKPASGIELPPSELGPLPSAANSGEMPLGPLEKAPANVEKAPLPRQPAAAAPPISTIPLPMPQPASVVPAPAAGVAVVPPAAPPIEDDGDLIEKAWVDKAKQIVERTRDDPHKQSEELTVFKADYMKKRYGKTIKISQ